MVSLSVFRADQPFAQSNLVRIQNFTPAISLSIRWDFSMTIFSASFVAARLAVEQPVTGEHRQKNEESSREYLAAATG